MFEVQLGHPKIVKDRFDTFETVKDVFMSLFRAEEESVYLFWHRIPIRVRYREDLYHNIDDLIAMTWLMQKEYEGAAKAGFSTQLCAAEWSLEWRGDNAHIAGRFHAIDALYEPYTRALAARGGLDISRRAFLSEWKTLLHQIVVCFEAGGVTVADGTERRKLEMLQRVEKNIEGYGRLYARPI